MLVLSHFSLVAFCFSVISSLLLLFVRLVPTVALFHGKSEVHGAVFVYFTLPWQRVMLFVCGGCTVLLSDTYSETGK